ncbi:sulfate transporter [Alicycliphilus sp. B1]|nr:sulfate transporter [Alicycliphilus sp. B1]
MPVLAGHDGQVQVWRLYGALFFGATKLLEAMEDHLPARALVLDLKNVIYVDSTGAEALEHLSHACATRGVRLIVSGLISQPLDIARRTGLYERLRPDLQPDVASAAAAAVGVSRAKQSPATPAPAHRTARACPR